MAGFMVFVGGSNEADAWKNLGEIASSGVYAALLTPPKGHWGSPQEGTFADYATVEEGDAVFFFSKRKIYGIGRMVSVDGACSFVNFPGGSAPSSPSYEEVKGDMLRNQGPESLNQRWLCTFSGDPGIFKTGVDIDDVLSSDPQTFKSLRAMQSVSFARMDDRETQSLRDVILRANTQWLDHGNLTGGAFEDKSQATHDAIALRVTPDHLLDAAPLLHACAEGTSLKHEMALEAGLVAQLVNTEPNTAAVFGEWDYITHQVLASPFKPLSWADRMDVFGYAFLEGFEPTRSKFLVIEAKKDAATVDVVDQVMKYVDWVRDEYAGGDYSTIDAFVVASSFPDGVIDHAIDGGRRIHTVGRRPAVVKEWNQLTLVEYQFDARTGLVGFSLVPPLEPP
jgi:hypothetical protein